MSVHALKNAEVQVFLHDSTIENANKWCTLNRQYFGCVRWMLFPTGSVKSIETTLKHLDDGSLGPCGISFTNTILGTGGNITW
jgi:hypothetical protein